MSWHTSVRISFTKHCFSDQENTSMGISLWMMTDFMAWSSNVVREHSKRVITCSTLKDSTAAGGLVWSQLTLDQIRRGLFWWKAAWLVLLLNPAAHPKKVVVDATTGISLLIDAGGTSTFAHVESDGKFKKPPFTGKLSPWYPNLLKCPDSR